MLFKRHGVPRLLFWVLELQAGAISQDHGPQAIVTMLPNTPLSRSRSLLQPMASDSMANVLLLLLTWWC